MSLNYGSVPILAGDLGYLRSEGVDAEFKEYAGSPQAAEALASGEVDFAQIDVATAIRRASPKPSGLMGFWMNNPPLARDISEGRQMLVARPGITELSQMKGKRVGITSKMSAEHPRVSAVMSSKGLDPMQVVWVEAGAPANKVRMLEAGELDAAVTTIQTYIPKLDGKGYNILIDGAEFRTSGVPVFLVMAAKNSTILGNGDLVLRVTRALILAAREFAESPAAWVEAASKRRPDVRVEDVRKLWGEWKRQWPVNGVLDPAEFTETVARIDAAGGVPARRPDEWFTRRFVDAALRDLGTKASPPSWRERV